MLFSFLAATLFFSAFTTAAPSVKRCDARAISNPVTIAVAPGDPLGWADNHFVDILDLNNPENAQASLTTTNSLKTRLQVSKKQGTIAAYMGDCADQLYYLNIIDEEDGTPVRRLQWSSQKLKNTWEINMKGSFAIIGATGTSAVVACDQSGGVNPPYLYQYLADMSSLPDFCQGPFELHVYTDWNVESTP